jgi:hypothetical protein
VTAAWMIFRRRMSRKKSTKTSREPDVVRLDEVARPCDVVAQERRPVLAVASGPGTADVPLDGSLADADAEVQQLATDALGAPARGARRHLSDQCRARGGRPSRRPRAPPEGAESGPMPAEDRRRLDEQGCLTSSRRDARGESNAESLPRCLMCGSYPVGARMAFVASTAARHA